MVTALVLVPVALLGLLFYLRSVASRRHYRCPSCGDELVAEHMTAQRCSSCGAPMQQTGAAR